jgi:hypothetical protein
VAYAQWSDKKSWLTRSKSLEDLEALTWFRESIDISYPDLYMEVTDDLFKLK